jgi:enterochelin esterase family protein
MNLLTSRTACKFSLLLALSAPLSLAAQTPAHFRSTDIHPDRSVTFSYKDSAATKVTLALDGVAKPIPVEKDVTGVWTVTTQPLSPEIYGYHFEADGDKRLDPTNPHVTLNLVSASNLLTVPGDSLQL